MCIYIYAYDNNYKTREISWVGRSLKRSTIEDFWGKGNKGAIFNPATDKEELVNLHSPW